MSMWRVFSCAVGRRYLILPVCSLGRTLLAFALLHSVLQPVTPGVSWHPTFSFQSPIMKRTSFLGVSSKRSCRSRTVQLQLLQLYWLGHRLGLPWYWMFCLGNEQRPFCHFWDCIKVLHSDSFVDYDGYSISSKGFLSAVVDMMVIWVKFTHSSPF